MRSSSLHRTCRVLGRQRVARRPAPDPPRGPRRRTSRTVRAERRVVGDRTPGVVRDVLPARRVRSAVRSRGVGHQPRRQRRSRGVPLGHHRRRVDRLAAAASPASPSARPCRASPSRARRGTTRSVDQHWQTAADVTRVMVQGLVDDMPAEPVVLNINVPDVPLDEITGWTYGDRRHPAAAGDGHGPRSSRCPAMRARSTSTCRGATPQDARPATPTAASSNGARCRSATCPASPTRTATTSALAIANLDALLALTPITSRSPADRAASRDGDDVAEVDTGCDLDALTGGPVVENEPAVRR